MCGIIAYHGQQEALPYLIKGLQKLEYRGYDSIGIAVCCQGALHICKTTGGVDVLQQKVPVFSLKGTAGIGHTRWATHGKVNDVNAHPHVSPDNNIAVVHNGIIENSDTLRKKMSHEGMVFRTQTDTEVVPLLLHKEIAAGNNPLQALEKVLSLFQGSYALAVLCNNELYVAKKESPLCIGKSDHGYFVSSDPLAIQEWTQSICYLEDGDYAKIGEETELYHNGQKIIPTWNTITIQNTSIEKQTYPHFMLKEIHEQSTTLLPQQEQTTALTRILPLNTKVFLIGMGSSYFSALYGAKIIAQYFGVFAVGVQASETECYQNIIDKETTIIAISQSGETADVLDAVKKAKGRGATCIALLNRRGSALERLCDHVIPMCAGQEISVAATKSFTAQLAAFESLITIQRCAVTLNHTQTITQAIQRICADQTIESVAKKLATMDHIYLIGRDEMYPIALEGALKMKEVSYVHAEGFSGGELKHGALALIQPGTPLIVLAESHSAVIYSNAQEVKARGGYVIGIDRQFNEVYDSCILVPQEGNAAIKAAVVLQLLAYYVAKERGNPIDKPRNLAKVVTVK